MSEVQERRRIDLAREKEVYLRMMQPTNKVQPSNNNMYIKESDDNSDETQKTVIKQKEAGNSKVR